MSSNRKRILPPVMASRRDVLVAAGGAGAMLALRSVLGEAEEATALAVKDRASHAAPPFGPLEPDPARILDLPRGFTYRILARAGETMDDGLYVPGKPDGMAAFAAGGGRVVLVCNHELDSDERALSAFGRNLERLGRVDRSKLYDAGGDGPSCGGTTTLLYDPRTARKESQFLSLAGTAVNCAGGPTPWGSWLSCEETTSRAGPRYARDHGWVFEVPAMATGPVEPVPLTALGRFEHEAAAVDPRTGVVYLTEDRRDGLFYRMIPARPGDLTAGGRLQALAVRDWDDSADTRNWPRTQAGRFPVGEPFAVVWVDMDGTDSPDDDLRLRGAQQGAAVFARGEGIWFGDGELYFACTTGGTIEAGQIFRYRPSADEGGASEVDAPGTLELFVESTDRRVLDRCDNLTVSPWGDLIVCEDSSTPCSLVGVTRGGSHYLFADNTYTHSELAGVCFAPDGRTLFVNVQKRGLTLAITGPFPTG